MQTEIVKPNRICNVIPAGETPNTCSLPKSQLLLGLVTVWLLMLYILPQTSHRALPDPLN